MQAPFPSHIQWLLSNLGEELGLSLAGEEIELSAQQAISVLMQADPSRGKLAVDWLVKTYIAKGFRWEDAAAGKSSKACETLEWFVRHRQKLARDKRNLWSYGSLADVYLAVEPFLQSEISVGSKEEKRRARAEVLGESRVLWRDNDSVIAVPLTRKAAQWWGLGTRWCTAAEKDNMFAYYHRNGPLIVVCSGDEKFQLHATGEQFQFMNSADQQVSTGVVEQDWQFFEPLIMWALAINGKALNYVPDEFITPEICKLAIEHAGDALEWVPERFKSQELVFRAVELSSSALIWAPKEYLTSQLCLTASINCASFANLLPLSMLTEDFCKTLVGKSPEALRYIPHQMKTKEMCLLAVSIEGYTVAYVPDKIMDHEILATALNSSPKDTLNTLIHSEFFTQDMYIQAVSAKPTILRYAPKEYITEELCRLAVEADPITLIWTPTELRTQELCTRAYEICVHRGGGMENIVAHIPQPFLTKEMLRSAIVNSGMSLYHAPEEFIDRELCELAVAQAGKALCYVPKHLKTLELCWAAVRQAGLALEYVPLEWQSREFCLAAVQNNGWSLNWVPAELKDLKMCNFALDNDHQCLKFVPAHLLDQVTVPPEPTEWQESILNDLEEKFNNFFREASCLIIKSQAI